RSRYIYSHFYFNAPVPRLFYTLSLHDALPILMSSSRAAISIIMPTQNAAFATSSSVLGPAGMRRFSMRRCALPSVTPKQGRFHRSEEHTSELQSRFDLVCRLLLEKKK